MSDVETKRRMLIEALRLLAAPYDQQAGSLPPFVSVADEIALTFDETYPFSAELVGDGLLDSSAKRGLDELDSILDRMSREEEALWTAEALRVDPRWHAIRVKSCETLARMGATPARPNLFWTQYVEGD